MLETILTVAQVVVAIFLVIVILLQRSDGGLGALSGGGVMPVLRLGEMSFLRQLCTWQFYLLPQHFL